MCVVSLRTLVKKGLELNTTSHYIRSVASLWLPSFGYDIASNGPEAINSSYEQWS